jgi:nucleoside-diphosphate-sugar epimerase
MKNVLVSGAGGFIGFWIAQTLLKRGYRVRGVDCFLKNYPKIFKIQNIKELQRNRSFDFREGDLNLLDLVNLLEGIDIVIHLAALPGVRTSWGEKFEEYLVHNVLATQKLLEACKNTDIELFVYASSSSVYGDNPDMPLKETSIPMPKSPYGVTKLAGENLSMVYYKNYGLPCVCLRFFTVYGPKQRPDMAFHKFFKAIRMDEEITVFGDGNQKRDFTYIEDVIEVILRIIELKPEGKILNLGGGHSISINEVLEIIGDITKKKFKIKYQSEQKGDVQATLADVTELSNITAFKPSTDIIDGLREEWEWIKKIY